MEIEHPQDQKSVSESRYSTSDKLAAALASGSAVVVIILALVEKTPLSVGLLVLLMVAFAVYPAIHFFRSILARVTVLVVVLVIGIVIGWQALKREKPREIVAARTSGPTNAATTPEHNALPVVPPQKPQIAAALTNADHDSLVGPVSLGLVTLSAPMTANVSFVHLDNAIKFLGIRLSHRETNPMALGSARLERKSDRVEPERFWSSSRCWRGTRRFTNR